MSGNVEVVQTESGVDLYFDGGLQFQWDRETDTWSDNVTTPPVEPPIEPPVNEDHNHSKAFNKVIPVEEYTLLEEDAGFNLLFTHTDVTIIIPENIEVSDHFGIFYQGKVGFIREDGKPLPEWNVAYITKTSKTGWVRTT